LKEVLSMTTTSGRVRIPSPKIDSSQSQLILQRAGLLTTGGVPTPRVRFVRLYIRHQVQQLRRGTEDEVLHELVEEILADETIVQTAPKTDPALLKWLWNRARNIIDRRLRRDEGRKDEGASEGLDRLASEIDLIEVANRDLDKERLKKHLAEGAQAGNFDAAKDLEILNNIQILNDGGRQALAVRLKLSKNTLDVRIAAFVRRARKFLGEPS
jgi:hypothetical protein